MRTVPPLQVAALDELVEADPPSWEILGELTNVWVSVGEKNYNLT